MKAVFVTLVALFAATASYAKEDKTITKVVKLLQDMLDKSKDESDKERVLYAKFKCYCDTNDAEKTENVASLEKSIELLTSAIDSLQSQNGELSGQVGQLKADMADNKAARENAENVRKKAKASFDAETADLKQAVDQMDQAITVLAVIGGDQTLAKSGEDHKKFMAGHKVKSPLLVSLGVEVKNALAAASIFLTPVQKQQVSAFIQNPGKKFTGTYTSQSAQIVGILKDMRSTFKTNLADAIATEQKEIEAFSKFMKTKTDGFKAMEKGFKDKQDTLSSNDEALTSKKKQLQTATKDKADAEDFLDKLKDMCAKKAKEFEERNLSRANEQAAIAEAVSILNSDSAFETFGSVSATSTGKTKAASFLQLGSRRSEAAVREQLLSLLRVQKTQHLESVAASIEAGNPFETVLVQIKKMLTLNADEAKEDKKNLDWCKSERKENKDNLDDRKDDILKLSGDIDKLQTTINDPVKGLKQQISSTEASLVQNHDSQVKQTKQRTEENVAYQADVRNLVNAEDLLSKAIAVLTEYYDGLAAKLAKGGAALAQEDPKPPETWDSFKGQSKQGGSAVEMLKYIVSETQKEEATAHADEEKAQGSYEDSMTDLKKDQSDLEGSLVKLQESIAEAGKDLIEKQEDLKDAKNAKEKIEDYLLKIKPGCDFITKNYETREKNRKTETDALKKAIKLIKETPAYKAAVQKAKEEGFGKCKAKCLKSEEGAKCKACLAGVTVPAYCAGHKGTPGC